MVASLVGGAILLFSCKAQPKSSGVNLETMITQQSDTLTMIYTKNGQKDYRFTTPLMERYEFARDPYMEFRYGIEIITFDSLGNEASQLLADYAIYYEKRELWEARGNVRGRGEDGRRLYTQQIFWDEKTDKVYSNVDTKVVDGDDVFVGEGFESDSEFKDWVFRESEGRMWVDASQGESGEAEVDKGDKTAAADKKSEDGKSEGGKSEGGKSEGGKSEDKKDSRGANDGDEKKNDSASKSAAKPAVKEREGKVVKPITPPSESLPAVGTEGARGRFAKGQNPGIGSRPERSRGLSKTDKPVKATDGSAAKQK